MGYIVGALLALLVYSVATMICDYQEKKRLEKIISTSKKEIGDLKFAVSQKTDIINHLDTKVLDICKQLEHQKKQNPKNMSEVEFLQKYSDTLQIYIDRMKEDVTIETYTDNESVKTLKSK